jgi:hypothetical protein
MFDSDHCVDVAGLCVLNDLAEPNSVLPRARVAPTSGKHIGSIAIHHTAILESLAAIIVTARHPWGKRWIAVVGL